MIVPSPSTRRLLEKATAEYQRQLTSSDTALKYLLDLRAISKEAVAFFRLGVVDSPMDGHETYSGRITVPYITSTGVTTIRFKYAGDPERVAKVLPLPGDVSRPYNATAVIGQTRVAICEGEPDVWSCWMAGIPAVGIPGANSWNPIFARLFRNRDVVVLADSDDKVPDPRPEKWIPPGQRFADMIYKSLGGCEVKMMPPGYDVASFMLEQGPTALRQRAGWDEN